jgi:hypothetical protein
MDMTADEGSIIDNLVKSEGMVSRETLLSNHPYVKDVQKEIEQIKLEKAEVEAEYSSSQFKFSSDDDDDNDDDDDEE